jgi:uncharacterized protein involved in exopolysaccharide biosynthesis
LLDSWWTVVTGVCFGLGLALVGLLLVPKEYRASATLVPEGSEASLERLRAAVAEGAAAVAEEGAPVSVRVERLPASERVALIVGAADPERAAQLADRLAETVATSGGRWVLRAPAAVPEGPVAPAPAAVYVWGQVVGLSLFVGPVLVRSVVNPVLRSPQEVHELTGAPPLGAIPRLDSVEAREESRRRQVVNAIYATFSLIALAVLVLALRAV